jgi:hypothetical protein
LLAAIPFALGALWIETHVRLANLIEFGLAVMLLLVVYVPSVYAIGLTAEERQMVLRKLGLRRPARALG